MTTEQRHLHTRNRIRRLRWLSYDVIEHHMRTSDVVITDSKLKSKLS